MGCAGDDFVGRAGTLEMLPGRLLQARGFFGGAKLMGAIEEATPRRFGGFAEDFVPRRWLGDARVELGKLLKMLGSAGISLSFAGRLQHRPRLGETDERIAIIGG